MFRPIKPEHFRTKRTLSLARSLLGKALVRAVRGRISIHVITEVEAYVGERDLACHAAKGRTPRTAVMYRPGGVWYIYLCYGVHEMLNLVVGPADYPAAILIRGVQGISGPGRLTKRLGIDRRLNGRAARPATGLHVADLGLRVPSRAIIAGPRIGVDYAGPVWSQKPWRFRIDAAKLPGIISRSAPPGPCSR